MKKIALSIAAATVLAITASSVQAGRSAPPVPPPSQLINALHGPLATVNLTAEYGTGSLRGSI